MRSTLSVMGLFPVRLADGFAVGERDHRRVASDSMNRGFIVTLAIGVIVALFGAIWALQGFGVLQGSPMSNTTTWSIIGPITAVIGVVVAVVSWRRLRR